MKSTARAGLGGDHLVSIGATALFLTLGVLGWAKLKYGFNFIDEGMYMTDGWRLASGDRLFPDASVSAILPYALFNAAIFKVFPDTTLLTFRGIRFWCAMFSMIALNNIMVSFLTFIGLFQGGGVVLPAFSFGSAYHLFNNGVMVGSFQYFFFEQGVFWESVRTIWIHGTLEISAIIIAGGAGLAMGNSLLFPGTYPRLVSFRRGAIRGLKIVIGLVPIFITAALLEGFVTRYTEMPVALSVLIIFGSLAFILWYFVWLPRAIHLRDSEVSVPAPKHIDTPTPAASAGEPSEGGGF